MNHKSCPFCGGKPEYNVVIAGTSMFDEHDEGYIRCSRCYCRTRGVWLTDYDDDGNIIDACTEEDAWKQWDERSD